MFEAGSPVRGARPLAYLSLSGHSFTWNMQREPPLTPRLFARRPSAFTAPADPPEMRGDCTLKVQGDGTTEGRGGGGMSASPRQER